MLSDPKSDPISVPIILLKFPIFKSHFHERKGGPVSSFDCAKSRIMGFHYMRGEIWTGSSLNFSPGSYSNFCLRGESYRPDILSRFKEDHAKADNTAP